MPCSCFGKKDKSAGDAAEKYSRSGGQEPIPPPASAPAPVQAPAPAQTEPAPATPPTPVTPTSGDARLRPEDDPDKASRRRDVVASFYSDQCELIGFKATGSRPPSAVVGGGAGENHAATSSPLSSAPSSSRASALSRADLALKRREFFKDLAVNDMSSSRYGASQPSWRMVDSGSLTTPRRSYQQDSSHHHTLPFQARAGGLFLRPISTPAKATSGPDLHITNGVSGNSHEHQTDDAKSPEGEPLLGAGAPQESVAHHQDAGVVEPLLARQQSEGDQPTPVAPATPPVTPATPPPTPPARAEPLAPEIPSLDKSAASEVLIELAATHLEGSTIPPQQEEGQLVVQQQQYMQQVSVPSDDERLGEGSCILIKEAFPEEPRSHLETSSQDFPDTTNASGTPPPPSVTYEAVQDVSQHSSEQPSALPRTDIPSQRRPSLSEEEEEEGDELLRHKDEAGLDTDQNSKRPTSSPETSAPGSPQEPRQPPVGKNVSTTPPAQHPDAPHPQQESAADSLEEARLSPTIVGCIPKAAPTQEAEPRPPSPPNTPPTTHPSSPPAQEETRPPTPPTQPSIENRAPPSPPTPPSLSEPRMTCGVDVSSSPLEDDGLGSDIDDALGSLECLTEEGNNEKRATAST